MANNPGSTRILASSAEIVCAAIDAEQGLALLQALDDESALAEVARNAKLWEVRLAAVHRVTDSTLLESIAEATKRRDNRVYQYSYDLLRTRRRDLARASQAAQLAAAFRGLLVSPPEARTLAAGQLRELEKALAELKAEGEVPQECLELAAQAHERMQSELQALRELGAAAAFAETLRVESAGAAAQDAPALREKLAALSGERPAWLASHPTAAALASSLERARERLDELAPPTMPVPAPVLAPKKRKEKPVRSAAAPQWDEIRGLLGKLEEHLQAGRLADAQEIEKQISGRAASMALPAGLGRELKRHLAQLSQMKDWAKWGDDQGREQLIQAAEALLAGQDNENKPEVEELAASVRTLRDDWKKRDATRPGSKSQWERFDVILARAFKPVLEARARRAADEKAAAQARAALCDEVEKWLAAPETSAAGLKVYEAKRNDLARRSRALPFPGLRAERALRKRLDKAFKALGAKLDQARGVEMKRRKDLIASAEALRDSAGIGESIKSAIALQAAWKETGGIHLGRKDDQALWARFHAATSAVFERRDAERAKQNEERNKRSAERNAKDTERKARDDRRNAERRALAQKNETHRGRFDRLAARSGLIEKLESAAVAGGVPEEIAAEVAAAWKALPPLGMDGEKALQARLASAPQASAAKLEKGRAERDSMLLDLEATLGVPSPEFVAAQRRERQLKLLQERFKARVAAPELPEATVARWYAIAAPGDEMQAARMTAIVSALVPRSQGGRGA